VWCGDLGRGRRRPGSGDHRAALRWSGVALPDADHEEQARLRKAERWAARAPKGSEATKAGYGKVAKLRAVEADRRKDGVEKTSTMLATGYDLVRVEVLTIVTMTASTTGTVDEPAGMCGRRRG
jgi:putative transposase